MSPEDFKTALTQIGPVVNEQAKKPRTFTLSVKKKFENYSLLDLYTASFSHKERAYWSQKIESGNLVVDHQKVSPEYIVKPGQITSRTVPPKPEPKVS
ncbi:MAG: hypothetical protein ACPGD5_09740, partial [Salibacteraceae bacterium]